MYHGTLKYYKLNFSKFQLYQMIKLHRKLIMFYGPYKQLPNRLR